jgi:hypothetical protein
MHATKRGVVVAMLAAALALAGCKAGGGGIKGTTGGSASGGGTPTTGATAASKPVAAQALLSSSVARTMSAGTARIAMRTQSTKATLTADGVIDFRKPQALIHLHSDTLDATAIYDRDVVYEKAAPFQRAFGKPWLKIDISKLVGKGGSTVRNQAAQAAPSDPSQGLALVYGMGGVKDLGGDTVRGVATRHYRGVVDMRKAAARIPNPRLRGGIQQLYASLHIANVPTDVWLDAQGRVRRITYSYDVTGAGGLSGHSSVTNEYYDFGTPVHIAIPPASQVAPFNLFG